MLKEGHFNLVMLQVSTPQDASSDEYPRYKAFIDRCHDNGIRVTFDGRAGGQPIRLNSISADSVKANPVKEAWLSRNENGNPRWRNEGVSYWPNLNNADYRNRVLETSEKVKTLLYLVIVREILLRMKFVILENLKVPRRPEYGMANGCITLPRQNSIMPPAMDALSQQIRRC